MEVSLTIVWCKTIFTGNIQVSFRPPSLCLFNKGDSALCDDQKTTLAFCVAAKIIAMKVLELVRYQKSPSLSRKNKSLNELLTSISDSTFKWKIFATKFPYKRNYTI